MAGERIRLEAFWKAAGFRVDTLRVRRGALIEGEEDAWFYRVGTAAAESGSARANIYEFASEAFAKAALNHPEVVPVARERTVSDRAVLVLSFSEEHRKALRIDAMLAAFTGED